MHVNSEPQSIVLLVHGKQHVYDLGLSNGFEYDLNGVCMSKYLMYVPQRSVHIYI